MTDLKKNAIRCVISDSCYLVSLTCCTGPVMQTFLGSMGFPNTWIYLNTLLIQAVNMLTLIFGAYWVNKGDTIRKSCAVLIPQAILFLCYIPLCIWKGSSFTTFAILTVICMTHAVINGIYSICFNKLPYVVLDPQTYTVVVAVEGLVYGGLNFLAGSFLAYLAGLFSYTKIMLGGCIVACCLSLLCCGLVWLQKPIGQNVIAEQKSTNKNSISKVIRQPVFYMLAPANLLRGFSMGLIAAISVIALDLGFTEQITTTIVPIQSGATIIICWLLARVAKRENLGLLILLGCGSFLALPMLLKSQEGWQFLLNYFPVCLGISIIDNSIPAILRWIVPSENAGLYQAWRLAIHNCGLMLGTFAAMLLSNLTIMIVSAVCMLTAGFLYYRMIKRG